MNLYEEKKIAIVGISCRFPNANNPEEFWKVMMEGKDVITEIPEERWNNDNYYSPSSEANGKTNQKNGAFLSDIHSFDPFFFNTSPKEAIEMSPSQKLMMELAWEVVENSSIPFDKIQGSNTGVYIGNIWNDFENLRKQRNSEINSFSATGLSTNIIANRVSYHMGLTGPSFVVDTGCSSSSVALMLAIQALRDGSADSCIAGGINHILNHEHYVYLSKFGGLSSNGKCSSFSSEADGFVRAEGAGVVLLKRLSDALRDGDKIHAVIAGGAMNNNGFNDNMPATSITGQLDVLKRAYNDAGIDAKQVQYIETHGTGTRLGDPVEAKALGKFFSGSRINGDKLIIGSVKTNFGHTEAASGIAGVIKTILSVEKGIIPKNLNFNQPNPNINLKELKIKVLNDHFEWQLPHNKTRVAGVSSFGWGGTNAHIVFEEFKPVRNKNRTEKHVNKDHFVLTLSARSGDALKAYADKYINLLKTSKGDTNKYLAQICAATSLLKPDFEYRKAFVSENKQDLIYQLIEYRDSEDDTITPVEQRDKSKIVFVFPGQGSQWFGMGKELYSKEPAFKNTIDKCDKAFANYVKWSLKEELFTDHSSSKLNRIDVIQPYIFAMQIALADLWISWGIKPDSVVGHSMGEVAAAYISGTLSLDDAANIICSRSLLMNKLNGQGGAMAVTGLSSIEATDIIKKHNGNLSVAVENSPKSTVIAGTQDAINKIIKELEEKELFVRQVKVDVASHSPQMDLIKDELTEKVRNIKTTSSKIDLYSSVRGKKVSGSEFNANYWGENLRGTVKFSTVMDELAKDNHNLFIEVSPHPVLKTAMWQCVSNHPDSKIGIINSLHKEYSESKEMQRNLADLYEQGHKINLGDFFKLNGDEYIKLPPYPFQKENYEIKDLSELAQAGTTTDSTLHPLLGNAIHLAESKAYYWESNVSAWNLPLLKEHKVNDNSIFPASFYIEMIFAALKQISPNQKYSIESVQFIDSIVISEEKNNRIQLKICTDENNIRSFKFFKYKNDENKWLLTCDGQLARKNNYVQPKNDCKFDSTSETIDKNTIYNSFVNMGVEFGESFQNIKKIEIDSNNNAKARLELNDEVLFSTSNYVIHPIILDNCIHPVFSKAFSIIDDQTIKSAFVVGIEKIMLFNEQAAGIKYEARLNLSPINKEKNTLIVKGDIILYDENNEPVLEMIGVEARISDTKIKKEIVSNDLNNSLLESLQKETSNAKRLEGIESHLIKVVAKIIKALPQKIKSSMTFKNLGIDSIATVMLMSMIEKDFEIELSVQKFKDYPSIKDFSGHINSLIDVGNNVQSKEKQNKQEVLPEDRWFTKPYPNSRAKHLLFLFHDAGGTKQLFESWHNQIDKCVELIIVQLPGRNERHNEKPYQDINKLLVDLVPLMDKIIDRPFSIYGHSMGGLLGFEVARTLQTRFHKSPAKLMISGTPSLKNYENKFVNYIIDNKFTDKDIHSLVPKFQRFDFNDEVVRKMIDILMNDLKLIHSYKYVPKEVLSSAIVAFHAINDVRVQLNDVEKWKTETANDFTLLEVSGSHNFIYSKSEIVTKLINEELSTVCSGGIIGETMISN